MNSIERIEKGLNLKFSKQQLDIITSVGVPTNVISLAGSGKTTTLLARLFYMEFKYQIKPYNMLAITFSNSASADMSERYSKARKQLDLPGYTPCFKTFHALFKNLIAINPKYRSIQVVTIQNYKFDLLKMIRSGNDLLKNTDILDDMNSFRGWLINENKSVDGLIGADEYYPKQKRSFTLQDYLLVMTEYQKLKDEANAIDFDDMQYICYRELISGDYSDKIKKEFQETYLQVMIDEYQDICPIQVSIMDELIGSNYNSLEAIGDDDQCIYSFRGGDPKFIIDFEFNYPNAKRYFLSTNYRCPIEVLQFAAALVEKNQFRVKKDIYGVKEGGSVKLLDTHGSFSDFLTELRTDLLSDNVAVLVRENSSRTLLGDRLIRSGIPVDMDNPKWYLYNTKVWKRLMSIIKMVKWSDNHVLKSMGWLVFPYMKKDELKAYENSNVLWVEDCLSGKFNTSPKIMEIIEAMIETEDASKLIDYAFKLVEDNYKRGSKKGLFNLDTIVDQVKYIQEIAVGFTLEDFEKNVKETKTKLDRFIGSDSLKIYTMHSVKGLEFPIVYIYGANDDVFLKDSVLSQYLGSSYESVDVIKNEIKKGQFRSKDLQMYVEEERRVLYVALTRCKKKTVIVYDANRPALFINECLSGHKNSSVVKLNLDTKEEIPETPSQNIENNKKQKSEASEIVLKEIGFDAKVTNANANSNLTNVNSKTKANVDGAIFTDEDNVDSPNISDKISIKELAIGDELEDLERWNDLEIFGSTHRSTIDFDNISLDDLDNDLTLLG